MNWLGFAMLLIVVLVGVGMFFTGHSMGIQWALENFLIEFDKRLSEEVGEDGEDGHNKQSDPDGK